MWFSNSNSTIVDASFENISSNSFIYSFGNASNNYWITLENIYCNASSFQITMFFNEMNMEIVDLTFEDNSFQNFLYASSATGSFHSLTFQNITMTRNNITNNSIEITGGILNLILDSIEFNQNAIVNFGISIDYLSGGNIAFLNNFVFNSNSVCKIL